MGLITFTQKPAIGAALCGPSAKGLMKTFDEGLIKGSREALGGALRRVQV